MAAPTAGGGLPNFVIIGATKSGTSSLAHHVGRHPDSFIAPQKEVHFFDRNFDRGVGWYRGHFEGSSGYRARGEATPTYMYDSNALPRMAKVVPEARLVAALRDPVTRAYSQYWQRVARNGEHASFADAVAAEPETITAEDPHAGYLARGRYLEQLQRACAFYPRESLYVVLFEDLATRPVEVLEGLCGFLDLDPEKLPGHLERVVNPYVRFRSLSLRERSKRWPKRLRDLVGRLNTVRESYPPMDPDVEGELRRRFKPHNDALAEWLGRDLSVWDQ
jgi:Sulfotransferase domain